MLREHIGTGVILADPAANLILDSAFNHIVARMLAPINK